MSAPIVPGWEGKARRAARKHGLDPNIFVRQIRAESGGRNYGSNSAGAAGIAQFIASTAQSMGIDRMNPDQALNGAAKLMAGYVRKYGSYENALRAYNAGEGAIAKSHGYSETNDYVAKILGGHDPGKLGTPQSSPSASPLQGRATVSALASAPDPGVLRRSIAAGFMNRNKTGASLLSIVMNAQDAAGQAMGLTTVTTPAARATRTAGATASPSNAGTSGGLPGIKNKSPLFELFWQGAGGINVKHGKLVPQGFVSGHTDHVHVAAGPNTIVALGKLAQRMGLNVGENPHFGSVHPVHVSGSYHYKNEAIDVSGDPAKMRKYAHAVAALYGVKG